MLGTVAVVVCTLEPAELGSCGVCGVSVSSGVSGGDSDCVGVGGGSCGLGVRVVDRLSSGKHCRGEFTLPPVDRNS